MSRLLCRDSLERIQQKLRKREAAPIARRFRDELVDAHAAPTAYGPARVKTLLITPSLHAALEISPGLGVLDPPEDQRPADAVGLIVRPRALREQGTLVDICTQIGPDLSFR